MQNPQAQAFDERFKEVKHLLALLDLAKHEHLDVEFLDTFLEDYLHTHSIVESIGHSIREWDI
jgi:hypothetical protein